jgi:acetyl-CoA acetyltransferase
MSTREVVICNPVRTPIGAFGGSLKEVPATGLGDAAVAGGMENMDRAPYLLDGGRWGYRLGNAQIHDSLLRDGGGTDDASAAFDAP